MSGHSKWAKIRRSKGALDDKRGKLFSKIAKEIQLAAKSGGGDPASNIQLRNILLKAKEASMPTDTVKRAINKGIGSEAGEALEEIMYEGYGPGGVAMLVQAVTDNRNRTASEIRSLFTKNNGNMSESGSVAFLFDKRGQILVRKDAIGEDDLMGIVLDAGADDLKSDKSDFYEVLTTPEAFAGVRETLEKKGLPLESAETTMIPKTTVPLDEKKASAMMRLYEALDDHDDVQDVYANFEISEDVLAKIEKEE